MHIQTNITDERRYDHLEPLEAAALAWSSHGGNPQRHEMARNQVRDAMPLLARALDRLTAER